MTGRRIATETRSHAPRGNAVPDAPRRLPVRTALSCANATPGVRASPSCGSQATLSGGDGIPTEDRGNESSRIPHSGPVTLLPTLRSHRRTFDRPAVPAWPRHAVSTTSASAPPRLIRFPVSSWDWSDPEP